MSKSSTFRPTRAIAFALTGLLILATIFALAAAKPFVLPVVTAFVVGTMVGPAASYLSRHGVPRALSAIMIVLLLCGAVAVVFGLMTVPLIDSLNRIPELAATLRERFRAIEKARSFWSEIESALGSGPANPAATPPFQLPSISWMQPTLEFISPTFAEIVLFGVTLILFIASWHKLRRTVTMVFPDHDKRLRMLRILNGIESSLGTYLLTVSMINIGVGLATGLICAVAGMPNAVGLGALAATLNFLPIIGPIGMFVILLAVGVLSFPTLGAGLVAPLCFAALTFAEGHFIAPTIIGRRLQLNALAVFLAVAFWSWLWGPMGAFLASPLLIVGLVLREHLMPSHEPSIPA